VKTNINSCREPDPDNIKDVPVKARAVFVVSFVTVDFGPQYGAWGPGQLPSAFAHT
jgi:hypothetical protein